MDMTAHETPAIDLQSFIFYAIIQIFGNLYAVAIADKNIKPFHNGEGGKVDAVLIGYKVSVARHRI
jgi:hypothetical protein